MIKCWTESLVTHIFRTSHTSPHTTVLLALLLLPVYIIKALNSSREGSTMICQPLLFWQNNSCNIRLMGRAYSGKETKQEVKVNVRIWARVRP